MVPRHLVQPSAVLHLSLVEQLPAFVVADILRVADEVYIANLWLDHEQLQRGPRPKLGTFAPAAGEQLMVHRIEVGTPNFLELIGMTEPLLQTSSIIGAALGAAKVAVSLFQSWAEARKVQAETRKVDAEAAKLELETFEFAQRLKQAAPASEAADRASLQRTERMLDAVAEKLLKRYVRSASVLMLERAPPAVAATGEPAAGARKVLPGLGGDGAFVVERASTPGGPGRGTGA
jgi:hypothetical protein